MTDQHKFFLIVFTILALIFTRPLYRKWKRKCALAKPFPASWQAILAARLPVYNKLPNPLQQQLHQHIQQFIFDKHFAGCGGLEITDEIMVIIAAEACLLVLNRPSSLYKKLKWIYVYPSTFIAKREVADEYGVVSKGRTALLGESWQNGRIILAWDSVERGMTNFKDGHNVVLHEFAHQLDQEDGSADGAPLLYTRDSYQIWARVFSHEFSALQKSVARGKNSLIDRYGATNPAEFFAVVTEVFFEKPGSMKSQHPELYTQLLQYYRVNPEEWQ